MRLAVIGDIHGFWDAFDTAFFNQSDYDGLLFVGDLPRMTRGGLGVAREIAALDKPAWVIPGNHDGVTLPQLLAELKGWPLLRRAGAIGMRRRVRRLERALGPARLCGYQMQTLDHDLGLLVARPHAMGPDKFYYASYLKRRFGIADFDASAATLERLIGLGPRRLVILAHNGPAGLGGERSDPWSCDFPSPFQDFGDPDLRAAIDYARASGRQVLAVVAGHMHHRGKDGRTRRGWARDGDTLCINAARVARIRKSNARRHHIALRIDADGVSAETLWVGEDGAIVERLALG